MRPLRLTLLLAALIGASLCYKTEAVGMQQPTVYELYSWRESSGKWAFCLLASPSGVNVTRAQIFDKKRRLGRIRALEQRIARLPENTTILWLKEPTGSQDGASPGPKLVYPPNKLIREIKNFASTRKISVDLSNSESEPVP